ncbi:MAG TPA: glycosyltransferase [Bryobacteraceae bacterium]|nr:glycosyltransferase [Bryobacteraceae bacterium]
MSLLLSILVPVYNERTVVERSLLQVLAAPLPDDMQRELIVVDDCSQDGTYSILERLAEEDSRIRLFRHGVNRGKGAAIRSALEYARGDFCLVQDADLEYDPGDFPKLLRPLLDGHADAVFGSRYLPAAQTRVLPFWHSLINKTLTLISNMFCNLAVTDMETCYKVFRTDILKSIPIRSDRFGFEPEITMKSAKRKLRIYEVPINYHGRTYEEGKKIGWKDGLNALKVILHFWLIDDLYVGRYGRGFLNNLTGTPQYVRWICETIRPHLGDYVLEIGAGIGTLSGRLMSRRFCYYATESDQLYLHALQNRFLRIPNVVVRYLRPDDDGDFSPFAGAVDTVLCLNVLELMEDDAGLLNRIASVLGPGGRLVLLVPGGPGLYGTLDETLGHQRRYSARGLRQLLHKTGFTADSIYEINRVSTLVWRLYGHGLKAKRLNKSLLKVFDKTIWFWRIADRLLPMQGLSLIAVATRQ